MVNYMRKSTRQFIDALEEAPLFQRVGQENIGRLVVWAGSWQEAVEICANEMNDSIRIERGNEISGQFSQERLNLWNDLLELVKVDIEPIVLRHIKLLSLKHDYSEQVNNTARWDLVSAAMEYEYEDILRTRFYRDLSKWYFDGHLVCGWESEEPDARPIIY
jgi:hypothetical protein